MYSNFFQLGSYFLKFITSLVHRIDASFETRGSAAWAKMALGQKDIFRLIAWNFIFSFQSSLLQWESSLTPSLTLEAICLFWLKEISPHAWDLDFLRPMLSWVLVLLTVIALREWQKLLTVLFWGLFLDEYIENYLHIFGTQYELSQLPNSFSRGKKPICEGFHNALSVLSCLKDKQKPYSCQLAFSLISRVLLRSRMRIKFHW